MSRYTLEPGRCIMRDGQPFVTIHRCESKDQEPASPVDVNDFARLCADAPRLIAELQEALQLYADASIYITGELEEKIPTLRRARALAFQVLAKCPSTTPPSEEPSSGTTP